MPLLPLPLQDDARLRWQRLATELTSLGLSIDPDHDFSQQIQQAVVFSDYVFRQFLHHPHLWSELMQGQDLFRPYEPLDYRRHLTQAGEKALGRCPFQWKADPAQYPNSKQEVIKLLRQFRHREMLRIAVRDINGLAELEETMGDISALADTCIAAALSYAQVEAEAQWGQPLDKNDHEVELVVLGLGKLGAGELNFSSDVDLMFAYGRKGETRGGEKGRTSNEEFFSRLCRELIQLVGQTTADGFVFRVDTRLRPFGDSGPLVMHFDSLEDYYQDHGREWERYALIKARVVAGGMRSGAELLNRLKPFVFRRYLDYGTFDNLREMKERIDLEVKGKGLKDNIKLGPGGIREIEFFGQMFQLLRGGVEPALQIRPIRQVLKVLMTRGYIEPSVQQTLDQAYVFLRTVENRIQQWADQQEHRLPVDADLRSRMAAVLGFDNWQLFLDHLENIRRSVHSHFSQLLTPDRPAHRDHQDPGNDPSVRDSDLARRIVGIWENVFDSEAASQTLKQLGYENPQNILQQITALRQDHSVLGMGSTGHQRLTRLMPLMLIAIGKARQAEAVLERIFNLIRSIQRRTAYLALMLENPSILNHLVTLTGASPWIADFLCSHPVLLDELVDPRTLYQPPNRMDLDQELQRRLGAIETDDLEYQMESLRVFKQVNVLRVAASDITNILPLMKVSDHLSDIAETALNAVATLCWHQMRQRYGSPVCRLDDQACDTGFAIIAYGKLGGLELGYGSDLDLVFLHAAQSDQTHGGDRSIDSPSFFARLGQRVLHMLTTHTSAGILYEVDMRLRPSGASGMLVSHLDGFADYQRDQAWTWEHQALIRARAVYGDPQLRLRFESIRHDILVLKRDGDTLRRDVADMRSRLREQNQKTAENPDPDHRFDIKHGIGGIMDIEFIVQFLVLKFAHQHPQITRWTDNVRQLQALNEAGILDHTTAFGLRRAYLIYRAMVHRLNLRRQKPVIENNRLLAHRHFVASIWNRFF